MNTSPEDLKKQVLDARKRMVRLGRRASSLDTKIEEVYWRSPEVKRFVAYREMEKREREAHERAKDDLLYAVLRMLDVNST